MTVCFVSKEMIPFQYGGIGAGFLVLMKQLRDNADSVIFVTPRPTNHSPEWREIYKGVRVEFIEPSAAATGHEALSHSRMAACAVRRIAEQVNIDLIVAAEFQAETFWLLFQPAVSAGKRIPVLIKLSGPSTEVLAYDNRTPTASDRLTCAMEDAVIRHSTFRVSPSHALWNEVADRLGVRDQPCAIVPNRYQDAIFNANHIDATTQKTGRRFVYVGRLQKIKGVDILVEAFRRVVERNADCELVLIGRDLPWQELDGHTFIEQCHKTLPPEVLRRIQFLGHKREEEVAAELRSAYAAVFPSRWEGFGIAALEACATGVPIIVPDRTALAEIAGPGHPWTFPIEGGATAVFERIMGTLSDPSMRAHLSRAALERARQYAIDGLEKWTEVFNQSRSFDEAAPGPLDSTAATIMAAMQDCLRQAQEVINVQKQELTHRDSLVQELHGLIAERDSCIENLTATVISRDDTVRDLASKVVELSGKLEACDESVSERDSRIVGLTAEVIARGESILERDARIARLTAGNSGKAG